jgi:hypothetical protein
MLDSVGELLAGSPRLWSWVISSTWPCMAIMAITRVTQGGYGGKVSFAGGGATASLQGTQRISAPLYEYRVIDCHSESQT